MKARYRLLGKEQRLRVRSYARCALHDANGDEAKAKELVAYRLRHAPQSIIASILIGVAIKLAIELIVYWIKNRFATVPHGEFQPGEPGSE